MGVFGPGLLLDDRTGRPIAGRILSVYEAGTEIPTQTYDAVDEATPVVVSTNAYGYYGQFSVPNAWAVLISAGQDGEVVAAIDRRGTSVEVTQSVPAESDIPPVGDAGDAVIVRDTGEVWFWDTVTFDWVNGGSIQAQVTDEAVAARVAEPQTQAALSNAYVTRAAAPVYTAAERGVTNSSTADRSAALQAAIDGVPAGGTLVLSGDYYTTGTVTIGKAFTLRGGRIIANHDTPAITVTGHGVTLDGVTIEGRQRTTYINGARGISAIGTDAAPVRDLTVTGCTLSKLGGGGIMLISVSGFRCEATTVTACAYFGVSLSSVIDARIVHTTVSDVNLGGQPNSYGITATKSSTGVRSSNILIEDCTVTDVPDWAGIDTHGGSGITVRRCTVLRTKRGIDLVAGPAAGGQAVLAPLDVRIEGNVVDGGGVATTHGIGLSGAATGPNAVLEYATGVIMGNHVYRAGDPTVTGFGAYWVRTTRGLRVTGNLATDCGSTGLVLSYENRGILVTDFHGTDIWSDTHLATAIVAARSTYIDGKVAGVFGARGSRPNPPAGGSVNSFGYYGGVNDANTSVELLGDVGGAVTSPVGETSGGTATRTRLLAARTTVGRTGGQLAFFGGTPVAKPTGVTADAASIRAALISLGLIS